jgi:hypothetical protein
MIQNWLWKYVCAPKAQISRQISPELDFKAQNSREQKGAKNLS